MVYIVVFGSGNEVNRPSHSGWDVSHVALREEQPDGLRPEYGCILSTLIRYKRRPPAFIFQRAVLSFLAMWRLG